MFARQHLLHWLTTPLGNRIPFRIPPKLIQSNQTASESIPPTRFRVELPEVRIECVAIHPLEQAPTYSV